MKLFAHSCTLQGGRSNNQDSFFCSIERRLFAVADGVGGGEAGDVASALAVSSLETVKKPTDLYEAFQIAQKKIIGESLDRYRKAVMGTTFTAAMVSDTGVVTVSHVGDSRCYRFAQDCLQQLTEDQEFFDERIGATVLQSYLGVPDEYPLRIVASEAQLSAGDSLLLCSDGLFRQLSESEIAQFLREGSSDRDAALQKLCEKATMIEHSDNVTAVWVVASE